MRVWGLALVAGLIVAGCSSDDTIPSSPAATTTVLMDFTLGDGFYSAPLPSESRRNPDGSIDLEGFPVPSGKDFVDKLLAILRSDARGFGLTSGIFLRLSGPLADDFFLDFRQTVEPDASVQLLSVDPAAEDYLRRYPVRVQFAEDGGPFGAAHLLSLLPLQGKPLLPNTTYAAVVSTDLLDREGRPLSPSPATRALINGTQPEGLSDQAFASYRDSLPALEQAGFDLSTIAGWTVFRTDDPLVGIRAVHDQLAAEPAPTVTQPFEAKEVFPDYCVFESTLPMPVYQEGAPPFANDGGGWTFDSAGLPIKQGDELARVVVTLPRSAMPAAGFPVVLFSRTGGGGERPLVDWGVRAEPGGTALSPGGGPALSFARAGFAGVSVDGPHGGLRNISGDDEQFLMFNVANPIAMRDNVRQSAVELALQLRVLERLRVPASGCPGLSAPGDEASFDATHIALMGHSMGATIAPLTFAIEPRFGALLLSGAGGSWIANVVHKKSPIPVRGFAELIIGVSGKYQLHEHDPLLSLLQWAGEAADPPLYAQPTELGGAVPRHVLMMQGIVDTYIFPPIANTTSLSFGLDLAGTPLDVGHPELAQFDPLETLLPYSGATTIALPAKANQGGSATAVVVQHAEDGIEDGHEVVFQTEGPKHQYRCFLATWLRDGTPTVPVAGGELDPCE